MTSGLGSPGPIVVGVERSDRSREALALGRALGRVVGSRLILVTVYPLDARSATMGRGAYAERLAEQAESTLDRVVAPLSGARLESRAVPSTSVPAGLQQVADAEGAIAIVVGPSHRGPLGRIAPGSVGERLLRGARCPVAVAPRGYRDAATARIARVGVGSAAPEIDDALRAAVGLAVRTGAAIRVLRVVEFDALETSARDDLAGTIRSAVQAVTTPVRISGEVVDGYADDELARLSLDVDLLVCGASGSHPARDPLLGSVSTGILRKARCPVLVVPRGTRAGFAALRAPAAASASG